MSLFKGLLKSEIGGGADSDSGASSTDDIKDNSAYSSDPYGDEDATDPSKMSSDEFNYGGGGSAAPKSGSGFDPSKYMHAGSGNKTVESTYQPMPNMVAQGGGANPQFEGLMNYLKGVK